MNQLTMTIREQTAQLLHDDLIDVMIGFQTGSLAVRPQPAFITQPAQAEHLVHNSFCQNNLASYITRRSRSERIGIICRGCESRAVRVLVSEFQHPRELIYVIGVPCSGIVDLRALERQAGLGIDGSAEILEAWEEGDEVVVRLSDDELRLQRSLLLDDACKRCAHPNPVGADIVLGEPVPEVRIEQAWTPVTDFEALPAAKRYAAFVAEAERCIRCYACREACPTCYCTECFVDHNFPRWAETMITAGGTHAWHIIRAFHQTGRCVSCGACERACPMDIKMTYLTNKLNRDMHEQYGFTVGESDDAVPPFAAFTLDDSKRFVR